MASFNIQDEYLSQVNRKQILQKNIANTQLYMDSNKMADTDAKLQVSLHLSFGENTSL